jgi:hypothetical protein
VSYVSSVGAYSAAAAISPVRPNPDYAVARQSEQARSDPPPASFGPAARVTLSPEAQAYLQSQKADQAQKTDQKSNQAQADQAKAAEAKKTEEAEAQAKAEKAAAARKADEEKRAEQADKPALG